MARFGIGWPRGVVLKSKVMIGQQKTISHEIGHVIIDVGHPNEGILRGPAGLDGTLHRKRLMRSGKINISSPGHLLVKAEWDAAERWLRTEEAEGRIE